MKKKVLLGIIVAMLVILIVSLVGCASMERWGKDVQSDLTGGLNRTVNIYSLDGKKIASYEGKFDVDINDSGRVKFDLNGKRYLYSNAIVEVIEN